MDSKAEKVMDMYKAAISMGVATVIALILMIIVVTSMTSLVTKIVSENPYTGKEKVQWEVEYHRLCSQLMEEVAEGGKCDPNEIGTEIKENGKERWYTLTEIGSKLGIPEESIKDQCCKEKNKIGHFEKSSGGQYKKCNGSCKKSCDESEIEINGTECEKFGEICCRKLPNAFSSIGVAFCLDAHPEDFKTEKHIKKAVQALKEFGAKFIRIDLNWKDVEPERNKYNEKEWEWYRHLIKAFKKNGIKTILVIGVKARAPDWAKTLKDENFKEFLNILYDFSKEVGKRLGDLVDYYQLSDEENTLAHEWFSSSEEPEAYYVMYHGLLDGDKNGKVITIINPFGSGEWKDVAKIMKNKKAKESIKIIAPDPYPSVWEPFASSDQGVKNLCKDINDPSHPFYGKTGGIMETGCCGILGDQSTWIKNNIPEMIKAIKECNQKEKYKIKIFCYYDLFTGDMNFGLIDENTLKEKKAYYVLLKCVKTGKC